MKLGTSIASLVFLGTACGVVPGVPRDPAPESAQTASCAGEGADCDTDGTPLLSTAVAPLRTSEGEPVGKPCGPSRCKDGQFCCNESCGLCAPRGGICLQRQCGPATVIQADCIDDSACRMFSSYCDGCQCLPGGLLDPDPSCHSTVVTCILDPCHHQRPACIDGVCAIMND